MKLTCPYCGDAIPYDRSLAGQDVLCSYCEKIIKMPLVKDLPPEMQRELRQEQVKQQEQEKRKYLRKQDRFLKELTKEEQRQLELEEQQKQRELEEQIESVQQPVVEELAVAKRYPTLRKVSKISKSAALMVLLTYAGSLLMCIGMALFGRLSWYMVLGGVGLTVVPTLLTILILWTSGEVIMVFLDIADDVRMTRLLVKKQTYQEPDS